ncbi:MAG TPA: hypothetical protein VJ783_08075 [Pirellulales bacterium]|nr:hypothetical protein [Pirellulales bacterium]
MTRRFQFSLKWGIAASVLSGGVALIVCRSLDPWLCAVAIVAIASLFGALAYFFGGTVVDLMFHALSNLLP